MKNETNIYFLLPSGNKKIIEKVACVWHIKKLILQLQYHPGIVHLAH